MIPLTLLTVMLALLTLAGYLRFVWWFCLIDFFRLQYICLAMILGLISLYMGAYWIALLNLCLVAVNLYSIRHFLPHLPHRPKQDSDKSVFIVNACKDNDEPSMLLQSIEKANPQILLIVEMTEKLERNLQRILVHYPYRLQTPVRDGFSICLLSKQSLNNTSISYHGPSETPLLQANTTINGHNVKVFSAHPKPALSRAWYKERRIYFREIAHYIKASQQNTPVLVMGDFNSVPWEGHFAGFMRVNGLRSALENQGYKVTWPTWMPIMGIPMDHILISHDVIFDKIQICPHVGSDHYPLSINLYRQ